MLLNVLRFLCSFFSKMKEKEINFKFLIISSLFTLINSYGSPNIAQGLNWYESLPAVAMDYKVYVDAGKNTN